MIKKKILLVIIIFFFSNKISLADIKILVTVNNEIITNHDIRKESNYLEILNPNFNQLDIKQRFNIAKNYLIDQMIKEKEIKKYIKIENDNQQLIDDYLKNLYLKLGFNNQQEFENLLKQNKNYNLFDIKEKIKIELLWNELIYSRYNNQIKIDKKEILSKIDDMQGSPKKEYFLSEIIFSKKKDVTVQDLFAEIKLSIQEIGFNNTANIFSNADSSKFGGKVGWIAEISLAKKIREKLNLIKKGEFTDLIILGNNFLILKIEDIKFENPVIDKEKEIEKLIQLRTNEQLNKFSKIYFDKTKLNYSINER